MTQQAASYSVPEASEDNYRDFRARNLPTDTREELALQRVFVQDMMKACRIVSELELTEVGLQVLDSMEDQLKKLGASQEHVDILRREWEPNMRKILAQHVRLQPDIKLIQAVQKALSDIIANAEKMERIQRGRKLKIHMDQSMLSWLIREYVLPFVPRERRAALIQKAKGQSMVIGAEE